MSNEAFSRVVIDRLHLDVCWRVTDGHSVRYEVPAGGCRLRPATDAVSAAQDGFVIPGKLGVHPKKQGSPLVVDVHLPIDRGKRSAAELDHRGHASASSKAVP